MHKIQWVLGCAALSSIAFVGIAKAAIAQEVSAEVLDLGQMSHPATTTQEWLAQIKAAMIQVTGVRLSPSGTGLQIILETQDDKSLPVDATKFRAQGDRLIADIPNAVLALPNTQAFNATNPTPEIATVQVVQLDASTIQINVVGKAALPKSEVTLKTGQLIYTLNPTEEEADQEIVVTGQVQTGYLVPDTTTATKTDTPIRDIPASIQVVPRQVIVDQGITRISEITRNVSGVTTTTGPSGVGEFFTIRGFTGGEFGSSNEFRNGFRSLGLGDFNPDNIERVEVLKGPASNLYGQIEPGGLINFVTKQPLDRPYYAGQLEIGSFGFYNPSIDISGPLTTDKRLLYRLNVGYEKSSSFVDFVDRQIFQIAPSLTYKISDATKLTLSYEYLNENGTNNPGLPRNPIAFDLPRNLFLGEPGDTVKSEAQSLIFGLEHRFSQKWQLRTQFAWQSASFARKAFRIGRSVEPDGQLGRFYQDDLEDRSNSYSVQTNLIGKFKTGPIDHQLLFGIDWVQFSDRDATGFAAVDSINIFNPVYGAPRPTLLDDGADRLITRSSTIGLYLQDQVTLLPNLKLLVGGRYEFIRQTSQVQELDVDGRTSIGQPLKDSFFNQAFSPRAGIVYQPIQPVSLYASYSTSFVPNDTFTSTGELIEPTQATQYEVGVKTEVLDGKLAFSLVAYHITKTNVLRVDLDNPDFSIPIGEVRSRGIEFDLAGKPLPGWNIIASFFINKSEVSVGDEDNPAGDTLIDSPGSGASFWTTYEIQTGTLKGLGFGAGVSYVGEVEAELPNSFVLPAYVIANATIFYQRGNWRAALNFKNLFNTNYYSNQGAAIYPGDPFTVLGSVSFGF
jgi:iron complex outermembrane recepter protein